MAGKWSRYSLLIKEYCSGRYVRTFADMIVSRILYGATFDDYFHFRFYDYSHFKRDSFISHRRAVSLWREGTRESKLLMGNKVAFLERFRRFAKRDWCETVHGSFEEFSGFVKSHGTVFIKPIWASEGFMAQKFVYSSDDEIRQKYEELKNYPDKGAIVESYIEQHPEMSKLHGKSVNTIRISTYTYAGKSRIIACSLRIGASDSVTDNYDAGGYFAAVDIDSGTVMTPCFKDFKSYIFHPDSGEKVLGFQIPFWRETIEMIDACCKEVPGAAFVGWDVAIQKDGPCLIEGNTGNNAYRILQAGDGIGKWTAIRNHRRMSGGRSSVSQKEDRQSVSSLHTGNTGFRGKLSFYNECIARNVDGHYIRTYIDVALCHLIFGSTLSDYFMFRFYDLSWTKRNTFLTYRRVQYLWKNRSDKAAGILGNKALFMKLFKEFARRDFCDTTKESYDAFRDFCLKHGKVFIKPLYASEGLMAQKFEYGTPDDIKRKWNEIKGYPDGGALVEAYVRQHPSMMKLNPNSVNTIRVITYLVNDKLHFISATLRIGCGDSVTDNYSGGGLISGVDLGTGVVVSQGHRDDKRFIFHPSTNEKILGFEIPYWDKVLEMCRKAAYAIADAPFVGWDVAILDDGPCLIEGNSHSGYHIMQECDGVGKWTVIRKIKLGSL